MVMMFIKPANLIVKFMAPGSEVGPYGYSVVFMDLLYVQLS